MMGVTRHCGSAIERRRHPSLGGFRAGRGRVKAPRARPWFSMQAPAGRAPSITPSAPLDDVQQIEPAPSRPTVVSLLPAFVRRPGREPPSRPTTQSRLRVAWTGIAEDREKGSLGGPRAWSTSRHPPRWPGPPPVIDLAVALVVVSDPRIRRGAGHRSSRPYVDSRSGWLGLWPGGCPRLCRSAERCVHAATGTGVLHQCTSAWTTGDGREWTFNERMDDRCPPVQGADMRKRSARPGRSVVGRACVVPTRSAQDGQPRPESEPPRESDQTYRATLRGPSVRLSEPSA